jgi:transcriptional regulator with PAS, ATPase and Fis domain
MGPTGLVGSSAVLMAIDGDVTAAARSDAKVLITGESGVGKEVAARLIHARSSRHARPLLTLNCAGLPDTLLESELFGHLRGSFTGAYRDKPGILQAADGGTVFMDEVGEMSLRMQALLLRFLESGEVQPVGADRLPGRVDVRVVCATNRHLRDQIAAGGFREDLFYRLNVIHVHIPPLRERREDVKDLLAHFFRVTSERHGMPPPQLTPDAWERLLQYDWPGNVRELKNVVERLVVRPRPGRVTVDDLPTELRLAHLPSVGELATSRPSSEAVAAKLYERMIRGGETFWTVVYEPFLAHDLTRATLRLVVTFGLQHTQGRYSGLTQLFNMEKGDYKRFLNVLRKHDCLVPFHSYRISRRNPAVNDAAGAGRSSHLAEARG